MTEHEASRTLVKSQPELWAQCSDSASLARHLNGSFGAIRITRLEPETSVAWEGERASGTVRLEPSGWGTRVILTARAAAERAVSDPQAPDPQAPDPQAPDPQAPDLQAPDRPVSDGSASDRPEPDGPASDRAVPDRAASDGAASNHPLGGPDSVAHADHEPLRKSERRRLFALLLKPLRPQWASATAPADPEPGESAPSRPLEPAESAATDHTAEDHTLAQAAEAVLVEALDSLGRAHHRPFSRP